MEKTNELENTITREKQLRHDLEKMFEEHDKKNNEIMIGYESTIRDLQLKKKKTRNDDTTNKENIIHKHTETQTISTDSAPTITNSFIYTELIHLKNKVAYLEENLCKTNMTQTEEKNRAHKIPQRNTNNHKQVLTEGNRQTPTKIMKNIFTVKDSICRLKITQKTEGNSQTQTKKLENRHMKKKTTLRPQIVQFTEGDSQTQTIKPNTKSTNNTMMDTDEETTPLPLSDDEDTETTETRAHPYKLIRRRSINTTLAGHR